ncbi:condensation domain-containing protein [Streptomyces anulatus]|uniref:condensation domain-containing protein n=1 Tax=Streptomyces anulatus TaxID=1892 RepID=UPI002E302D90|nr:condensation domain-containing protein [Streptomyces anulatus]
MARRKPDIGAQAAPPPLQLGAYADAQRTTPLNESDLRHRTERLTGAPDLSTIPSDRTRPAELSTDGARIALRLDEDLTSAVRRFARATRTTPFAVLTAAAVALLHRHGTGDDIVVGTPMSRRANAGLDPVMDCLTDLMPLAFAVGADLSFRDLVRSARSEVLDLVRHRDVPFGELVRRTATAGQLGRFPLFQTVVQLNDGPESGLNLPGATAERLYAHSGTAKFDLCIGLAAENEAFRGFLDCATDLYAPATARRIADRYRTLPTSVLADPGLPLAETPLLSSDAYEVVTLTWACAARPADPPPVQAAFEACRRRTSNAAAAVWHDRQLTYEELGAAADRLAHQLIRTSSSGRAMGILMDHCPDMTVAVLAVLKSVVPHGRWAPLVRPAVPARERPGPGTRTMPSGSEEDGMPGAHAVDIALSLDGIHEGNGPLVVLPGSHRLGLLDLPEKGPEGDSDWQSPGRRARCTPPTRASSTPRRATSLPSAERSC